MVSVTNDWAKPATVLVGDVVAVTVWEVVGQFEIQPD